MVAKPSQLMPASCACVGYASILMSVLFQKAWDANSMMHRVCEYPVRKYADGSVVLRILGFKSDCYILCASDQIR